MKILSSLCLAFLANAPALSQDYAFTLNGHAIEPARINLSRGGEKWAEGDILTVDGFTLVLGGPGAWHFKTRPALRGILSAVRDGKEAPVAIAIETSYAKDQSQVINPLEGLNANERAGLRGLSIDAPIGDVEDALKDLTATQLALTISEEVLSEGNSKLPALPDDLRWLRVVESSNQGFKNLDALTNLTALRGLSLTLMTAERFDASLLSGMKSLRSLQFYGASLSNPDALAKLTELRSIDLSYLDTMDSVAWCAPLLGLEDLKIAGTGVVDLAPLSALPSLRSVAAEGSRVASLEGDVGFPSLETINLLACPIQSDKVAAFQMAHPGCSVLSGYRDSLAAVVNGATRLRVRSGGTCHRQEDAEETLVEIEDRGEIEKLLGLLVFEESAAPFHCMCCGNPSFEFYDGERLVATLGFHHGQGMRWESGPWPGDVLLDNGKAIALCDWLEQRGVKGAGDELREAAVQKAALERRWASYEIAMPQELFLAIKEVKSAEEAKTLFTEKLPDPRLRAQVVLSLFGCSHDSWSISAGMDNFLVENFLPEITAATFADLFEDPNLPAPTRRGTARWFFEEGEWKILDKASLAQQLPALAEEGLTSPKAHNRRRTILQLGGIASPEALDLLRKVLAGQFKPVALSEKEAAEAGGMVSFWPDTLKLPDDAPDTAHAAAILIRLNDIESTAAVEHALASMPEALRDQVRAAAKAKE